MTTYPFYNPFADNGKIIYGEQFVGRQNILRTIQQIVIDSPRPGNLAIVGAPRIGKSSLAYHALIYPQQLLIEKRILSFRINLPDVNNHEQLFREFIKSSLETIEDTDLSNDAILSQGLRILETEFHWLDLQNEVRKFFKKIKRAGWRVVIVIDEFDEARHIFSDGVGFQALRELAYQPEWSVCLVTLSRRSLTEICNQCRVDISNLPGIFKDEYLQCFDQEELVHLLQKFNLINLEVSPELFEFIWVNTGGHPYLASALAFELSKSWLDNKALDLDKALQISVSEFLKYYDDLVNILKEDGSLDKLLEIIFGPVITATKVDAERLVKYGLIQTSIDGYYTGFSSHFTDYLRLVERSIELWVLWRETEKYLRLVITEVMGNEYQTNDWVSKLEISRPKLKTMLEQCYQSQEKERKSFGGRASGNILDFTYPMNLYDIIAAHWNQFEPILKQNKNYWSLCFQLLAKVRNPMAHIRDQVIETHERQKAEGYCRELLHLLKR